MTADKHACPHCGSPARMNPCWWSIKHPEWAARGGDPPCEEDAYADNAMARERRFSTGVLITVFGGAGVAVALLLLWHFIA